MYAFHANLHTSFDDVIESVTKFLLTEEFCVLSDVDLQKTFRTKLGVSGLRYHLLCVCNSALAHEAIQTEPDIGLLLPCRIVVRESKIDTIVVGFLDPHVITTLTDSPHVQALADDAKVRLHRVRDRLQSDYDRQV